MKAKISALLEMKLCHFWWPQCQGCSLTAV